MRPKPPANKGKYNHLRGTARWLYVDQALSLRLTAEILRRDYAARVTPNMVRDILNSGGIDTSKAHGARRLVSCRTCGRPKSIARCRYRDAAGRGPSAHAPRHHYCDFICFRIWHEEHCRSQREARRVVEAILNKALPPDAVCHFIDDDTRNVNRHNIKVFTSTIRHIEEHRSMEYEGRVMKQKGDTL